MRKVLHFIKKEIQLDWRNSSLIGSILLYVMSSVYITFLAFRDTIDITTWNSLFWIITLFTAFNATSKSFSSEERKYFYLYTLISPQKLLLAKLFYNVALMVMVAFLSLAGFYFFISDDYLTGSNVFNYTCGVLVGSMGFAVILTMISAIASKTGNKSGMMAILGFPVIIPFLMATIKYSSHTLNDQGFSITGSSLSIMVIIIGLVSLLSYLLFPYIWRE